MSLYNRDEAFIYALKKYPDQRTEKDLQVIFSRLHRFEALSNMREQSLRTLCKQVRYERHDANEILYGKDDPCKCWFILLSGSIFIQGSMFLRNTSFGKQIPGTKRRGSQCLVLEPSEMIAIDYPDMTPLHAGSTTVRVPSMRNHSSSTSSRSTLDSVAEVDNSSVESSPSHSVTRKANGKIANGCAQMVQADSNHEMIKNTQEYDADQEDATSHDDPEQEDQQSDLEEEEQEDSISLHSSSSLIIKDLVTDVLKKDITERNEDDHDVLLEFTKSLQAFSNMTEPTRRELCKVMVFAQVDKAGTVLLKDNEVLDSWSVIINGQVQVEVSDKEAHLLYMGESFGVTPTNQPQHHKGTMYTMVDDCQFLCIAQHEYCEVLHQGKENMENVLGEDGKVEMVKEKREIEGGRKGHIVIRGTPSSLRYHLLEENSIDTTYAEDYLLTYRAFCNEPLEICGRLLEWFDREEFKAKVTRVILLWVNNHFNDFECDRHMMELLEKFEEKLQQCNKKGECRLFNIACSTKAKSRVITLSRSSNEVDLAFSITGGTEGYPIYILQVTPKSDAEEKGLKRGDQLLNVNGQNFEKLNMERANAILRKNTDLTLTVKTNLFAFKEMMTDLKNPHKKRDKNKKGKLEDTPVIAQISTMQPSRPTRMSSVTSESDTFDGKNKKEVPEDVIKVFRADQTYRFVFVNQDTTAEEAVLAACKEFGIVDNVKNYSLCRVSVQNENFVKQSKLPDKLSNLSEIPLSARYYLKNNMESEQLLPDENIPELLKEANYTFLDLNCFEVALHLTLQDYELFKTVEQTDFIDDLFHFNEDNLSKFKAFEDLVNRELFWVVSTMCSEPNMLRRAKMVKHFTKIAHHCKSLRNLNSTFAIISGLGYRAVSRMKATWEKVPAKCTRTFEDLQALMDPSRNMSKYRTLLNDLTTQPPVIPYIPVVKKDLTFLHLGNDTTVEGLVNFEKMRMIGREVRNVCRLCSAEASQIISSAMAPHHDTDKPSSNIYHTLTRRGRRSSFNNARKMYEDAVNARKVKQYMQQLKIENDEDKLMEMSKQVEASSVTSAQTKRRNTSAALTDSPSRSSKTLPGVQGSRGAGQTRNNSEPQLPVVAGLSVAPTRKKNPTSSLPKFGLRSRSKSFSSLFNPYTSPKMKKSVVVTSEKISAHDDTASIVSDSKLFSKSNLSLQALTGSNWSLLAKVCKSSVSPSSLAQAKGKSASTCDLNKNPIDGCFPTLSALPALQDEIRCNSLPHGTSPVPPETVQCFGRSKHLMRMKRKSLSLMPNVFVSSSMSRRKSAIEFVDSATPPAKSADPKDNAVKPDMVNIEIKVTTVDSPHTEPKRSEPKPAEKCETQTTKTSAPKQEKSSRLKEKAKTLSILWLAKSKSKVPQNMGKIEPKSNIPTKTRASDERRKAKDAKPPYVNSIDRIRIVQKAPSKSKTTSPESDTKTSRKAKPSSIPASDEKAREKKNSADRQQREMKLPPLPTSSGRLPTETRCPTDMNSLKKSGKKSSDHFKTVSCAKCLREGRHKKSHVIDCKGVVKSATITRPDKLPLQTVLVDFSQSPCGTPRSPSGIVGLSSIPSPSQKRVSRKSAPSTTHLDISLSKTRPAKVLTRSDSSSSSSSSRISSRWPSPVSGIPAPSPKFKPKSKDNVGKPCQGLQIKTTSLIKRSSSAKAAICPGIQSATCEPREAQPRPAVSARPPQFQSCKQIKLEPHMLKIKLRKVNAPPEYATLFPKKVSSRPSPTAEKFHFAQSDEECVIPHAIKRHELAKGKNDLQEYNTVPRNASRVFRRSSRNTSLIPKKLLTSPATERRYLH